MAAVLALSLQLNPLSRAAAEEPLGDERELAVKPLIPSPGRRARRTLDLPAILQLAERNYPKVQEARARLLKKRGELWEARTAPFSQFKVEGGLGVAPTVRGTSVFSPSSDVAITENMALAWEVGIQGLVPLWTFGKITSLWDAANANVKLGRFEVEKAKNEIRLEVRRAYYGVLLARDSRILLEEAMKRLDEYIVDLEERVEDGEDDEIDLLKIKMQRAELVARGTDADKGEASALAGLRFYSGADEAFDVPDVPLSPIDHRLGGVARYLEAARIHRPEVNMAKAGLAARRAQLELEKAKFYPDFGLGIAAKLQRAPEVTDQRNPFTRDPGNRASYGFGLVFRWNLDLLPQAARLAQARAQLEEVRATERYALGGIAAEVEVSHAEASAAKQRFDAWVEATNYAKRWMIKVKQGLDLGLSEPEDMVEPSKAYALKKASQMEALFDYNVALVKLAQSTGWEAMLK
jgi:outer membrane protein TolC